jgi:hypothetical protein
MSDRRLKKLEQRTRLNPIHPDYRRPPADRPPPGKLDSAALTLVKVYMDGGAPGTKTSQCTYTYTIKTLAGGQLATALTPGGTEFPARTSLGAYVFAPSGSYGLAQKIDGYWVLVAAISEQPAVEACASS